MQILDLCVANEVLNVEMQLFLAEAVALVFNWKYFGD